MTGALSSTPRSWLFVPAHRERMVARAAETTADAVIFDLEDSVPPAEKDAARALLASTLDAAGDGGAARYVRINEGTSYSGIHADLDAAVRSGLDGVMLPKTETPEAVLRLDAALDVWEAQRGMEAGTVRIIALIESPAALLDAWAIAEASPRLVALAFGGEDYKQALGGGVAAGDPLSLLYARSALAVAARAAGVDAVDGVWTDLEDGDGLGREASAARALGFAGKLAIHPAQIDAIHAAFSPGEAEVTYAREVLETFEAAVARGEGAVSLRGQMLDAPVVARARRVVEQAGAMAEQERRGERRGSDGRQA